MVHIFRVKRMFTCNDDAMRKCVTVQYSGWLHDYSQMQFTSATDQAKKLNLSLCLDLQPQLWPEKEHTIYSTLGVMSKCQGVCQRDQNFADEGGKKNKKKNSLYSLPLLSSICQPEPKTLTDWHISGDQRGTYSNASKSNSSRSVSKILATE